MFNPENYLKKFATVDDLIKERNRIHQKYYLDQTYYKSCSEDTLNKMHIKMRALGSEFAKVRKLNPDPEEDQDSAEWIAAWGGCPTRSPNQSIDEFNQSSHST